MATNPLSDEDISHSLNEDLLKEASEIKEEKKTLQERLEKLEENRGKVSDAVYQKVRADYSAKQKEAARRLLTLKQNLEKEEKALKEKKRAVEGRIKIHREKIEESELRFSLGEYSDEEHQAVIARETQEVERLEEALKGLEAGSSRHQEIFEGTEDASSATIREAASIHESTSKIPIKAEPAPQTSSPSIPSHVGHVGDAGDVKKSPELHVMENGKVIQTVPIDKTVQIGRSPANDIVLKEPKVSRKHAEIQIAGGKYILLDIESSNGTFVGGKRITEHTLQPNDEIVIGNTKMVFKG